MGPKPPPVVLSIAGYDPSSGAGVTADVKTAAAHGCYAIACITAMTVQSTVGVERVSTLDAEFVLRTLQILAKDFDIAAVRLGMLGSGAVAQVVADFLAEHGFLHVVLDPVLRSSSGAALLDDGGLQVIRERLLALARIVTPNIEEAAVLVGAEVPRVGGEWELAFPKLRRLAAKLHQLGSEAVVITGGHLSPANDYLSYIKNGELAEEVFPGGLIESRSTHGTGCAFATALACELARGNDLSSSVRAAKEYVRNAILTAYPLGKGRGPLNHFWQQPK